ncbi:hypothetical protein ACHAWF_001597 [Thalassiosira exigua]
MRTSWAWISSASPLRSQRSSHRSRRCTCPAVSHQYPVLSRVRELLVSSRRPPSSASSPSSRSKASPFTRPSSSSPSSRTWECWNWSQKPAAPHERRRSLGRGRSSPPLAPRGRRVGRGRARVLLGSDGGRGVGRLPLRERGRGPLRGLSAGAVAGLVLIPLSVVLAVVGGAIGNLKD